MSMDFQKVVDSIPALTAVISVEKREDGSCGDIRIVTGNKAYIDSIEHPMQDVVMLTKKFTPNSLYTDYLTRDLNFEDFCYRAAVQKKCLHSYAHPDRFNVWFNMIFMPLCPDDGDTCYCTYTVEVDTEPSSERMSNISGDIAASVLETAITLRSAQDFKAAMKGAVDEIRELCDAENCCILSLDNEHETCQVLGESYKEGSPLMRLHKNEDAEFYNIASTWKDTISGSNCIIAKNASDMEVVRERNQIWYDSLVEAGVKTVALFPLKVRNEHIGYIWAVNFIPEQYTRIKEILELTSFVLGSEISNYLMMKRLKYLSSRDMLTGVMNRNEMNNYVAEMSAGSEDPNEQNSVGVIFTDLNGLKRINDSVGHIAGDELIIKAADSLRDLFDPEVVFRAGGDEFVVILTGVTEEELQEYKEKINEAAAKHSVSMAVGCSFEEDSRNVRRALSSADQKMYDDKMKYYEGRSDKRIM